MYIIKKYIEDYESLWDNFIENKDVCFGTIYHTRKFLNYHGNKFKDESILIYDKNILITILPCCKIDDIYFSHKGATYGGPVILKEYTSLEKIINILQLIFDYYNNKLCLRIANDIYFDTPIHILYYNLTKRLKPCFELSWYINTNDNFINNIKNKNNKSYTNDRSFWDNGNDIYRINFNTT